MRKSLLLIILFFGAIGGTQAQLLVTDTLTPQEMADKISGTGVTIFNPVVTCPEGAYGAFEVSGVSNFDEGTGVMLATGILNNAIGPNTTQSKSTAFPPAGDGDPDLEVLNGGIQTDDACKFEFDIIPDGDTLRFDFTFASEEYLEYVCTNFNDAFGFLISGPGIVGDPGLGGKKNIALIPGTSVPVTINNVNGGNPTQNPPCPPTNGQYYHNNPLSPIAQIQYDGWTNGLFALATDLQPCETYHLELVIADAVDQLWDSGVFIEQIRSNNIKVSTSTAGGVDFMIEGCNPGVITFERLNSVEGDLDIDYFLHGTATNGPDYGPIGQTNPALPNTITIPDGQETAQLLVNPYADGLIEGIEYIDIIVGNPLCGTAILDSVRFFIRDSLEVDIIGETLVCAGDTLDLEAVSDAVEYDWGPASQVYFPSDTVPITSTIITEDITLFASGKIATCITTAKHEVTVNTLDIDAVVTDSICLGSSDGEIDITVTNGTPGFNFEWTGPGTFMSGNEDLTGLEAGTYTVVVTDADGCTNTASFSISSFSDLEIDLSPIFYVGGANVSCNGASDGKIFAIASEGVQPYTYTWNDPAMSSGEILDGIPAGTYTVLAIDAVGCGVTDSVTLSEPDPLVITIDSQTNSLCFGEQDGSAIAGATGGFEPYEFLWYDELGEMISSDSVANNLTTGIYSVSVTDANLCKDSISFELVGSDAPIQIQLVSQTNVSCAGDNDGSAMFTAIGGTVNSPSDYTWTPSDNLTGLAVGSYVITVTDLNGCTEEYPLVIAEPSPLTMTLEDQQNITCLGEDCGSAIVFVEGGTPPYDFLWEDGTVTINNLELCQPGTYTPMVTDSLGCTDDLAIEITSLADELTATFDVTNVLCGGDTTGVIDMTIIGGMAPYNIVWAGGECEQGPFYNMEDLPAVCAGEWCVFIEDANGCSFDTCFVVTENPPLNYSFEMTPAECFGAFTGDIDLTIVGGAMPYSFEWYGGVFPGEPFDLTTPIAVTEDLLNWPGAIYLVQVTDDNGCTLDREITITAPDNLMIDTLSISNYNGFEISCPNACDGEIDIDVTGGTTTPASSGNYTYEWKEQTIGYNVVGIGTAFQDQMGLCASEDTVGYEVIVVDDNMCLLNAFFIMEEPEELQIELETDSVTCSGADDGSATATVLGGIPGYTFEWFDDHTLTNSVGVGNPLTNVSEGLYYVAVTDMNGCVGIDSIEIATPDPLIIQLFAAEFNGYNINGCSGEETGFIAAAVSGGTTDYIINWTDPDGNTINTTDFQIENLAAGSDYCLEIIDQMDCMTTECIELTEPMVLDVMADIVNVTCAFDGNGSITLTINGGVNPTVFWADPDIIPDDTTVANDLEPGIYYVTVFDDNDCQDTFEYEITEPLVLNTVLDSPEIGDGNNIACNGDMDAVVNVTTTGGTPDFIYDWQHIVGAPDPANLSGLGPGNYILLTTDDNGCIDNDTIDISEPEPLTIDIFVTDSITCFGVCDGQLATTTTGGVPAYTDFNWDFGFNGPITPDTLCVGTYEVTVTDINGCTATNSLSLDGPAPIAVSSVTTDITCFTADDGEIDITILGGTPGFDIYWTFMGDTISTNEDLTALAPGEYCLSIVDANECAYDECYTINEPSGMDVTFVLSDYDGFNVTCGSECDGAIDLTVMGGTGPYTYDWADLPGNMDPQDRSGLCAGPYTVVVSDLNGCTITMDFNLTQPSPLEITLDSPTFIGGTNINCVGDSTGAIIGIITGGVTIDTLYWTLDGSSYPAGAGLLSIDGLTSGTYVITVEDVNGCTTTASITLTEPTLPLMADIVPSIYPSGDNISCFGACDGSFTVNISGGTPGYSTEWRNEDLDVIDPFDLCEGIYSVLVIDSNMCIVSIQDTLFEPPLLEADYTLNGSNECSYDQNVIADLTITGGSPGYIVDWAHIIGSPDSTSAIGLGVGTYPVVVTDTNGCVTPQINVEVMGPEPLQIDTVVTDVSCNGFMDGSIMSTTSGGTVALDYLYQWSIGSSATTPDINSLDVGMYQLLVEDDNGCLDSVLVEITEPDPLLVTGTATEALCGDPNGTVDIDVSGGTSPYDYDWECDGVYGDDPDLGNAFAGDTTLCVIDDNGCTEMLTLNVPGIENAMSLDVISDQVSCAGAGDGSVIVIVQDGTPTFEYVWTDLPGETGNMLDELSGGVYEVTVTDDNNCTEVAIINIAEPDSLEIDISPLFYPNGTNLTALGACDGAIEGFTFGGNGGYTWQWTGTPDMVPIGQDTLQSPTDLCEGEYCVEVTDSQGCLYETCALIDGPDEILVPGGISPNGDGVNDGFVVVGLDAYPENSLKIFNRWGNIVFEQDDYMNSDPWVGEGPNGNILPDGTYFVVLLIPGADFEYNDYVELRR
ncbi:MAG: hypothetical protein HKN39_05740 [Flavobacteriales bacterium]|nr:hypothetical protein [Flavobacteriales bacterium]